MRWVLGGSLECQALVNGSARPPSAYSTCKQQRLADRKKEFPRAPLPPQLQRAAWLDRCSHCTAGWLQVYNGTIIAAGGYNKELGDAAIESGAQLPLRVGPSSPPVPRALCRT